jgi:hypothetical protein
MNHRQFKSSGNAQQIAVLASRTIVIFTCQKYALALALAPRVNFRKFDRKFDLFFEKNFKNKKNPKL